MVDTDNRLVGILGYGEFREVLTAEHPEETLTAGDPMRTPPPLAYPDETLSQVTEKFGISGVGRLPVVPRDDPSRLLGVISHTDVLAAYERVALNKRRPPRAAALRLTGARRRPRSSRGPGTPCWPPRRGTRPRS